MMRIAICVLAFATCGCGTFVNLAARDGPYGGVRMDVAGIVDSAKVAIGQAEPSGKFRFTRDIYGWLCLVEALDVPFSVAGDTVTLPIASWQAAQDWWLARRQKEVSAPEEEGSGPN